MIRFLLFLVALAATTSPVDRMRATFHKFEVGAYPPGSRVPIYMRDLNPYLNSIVRFSVPEGLRNIHLAAGPNNTIEGTALIDFLKIRQARGDRPGWLTAELLGGERPVDITVRLTSAHGTARVNVLRASVSGIVAEGRTLDFLISTFVMPNFPDAKIDTDFALGYNIDHFEIQPGVVYVVLRK